MSLDYTTLQAEILATSVHSELDTECPSFIRKCEALIRRKLLALELRVTLDEADREAAGIYNLSGQVQQVRAAYSADAPSGLQNVGIAGVRSLSADADVIYYALSGQTIEFRGVPGTDEELDLLVFGWPDPLTVSASNELLTNHEDIYTSGSLFYLYNHTQDLELAQSQLSIFTSAVEDLNNATLKKNSGGSVMPAYNFGHIRCGRSY